MKVLVSGSSGLIGSGLLPELITANHEVVRLVRRTPRAGEIHWNPATGDIDRARLAEIDAVVHLAGENVAGGRWTPARKTRIRDSRVAATRLLCEALAAHQPRVFVGASAVGYYGDRGDQVLTEASPPGEGFLPETCVAWERATTALPAMTRTVLLRTGIVLALGGGALRKMLPAFCLGLGGRLGSGRQFMSWIALPDVVQMICYALEEDSLSGACNATAPRPVTNCEFTATLAHVLRRPALLPAPAFALRLALGEMADALLLASARATPDVLQRHGYTFRHADLEAALRTALGRTT